ncbi:MAG: polymer-forming cytoskeletal protein [Bacteroidota bacterium]|nr:polymer-forming cytoskeletal protein [Bacteroidota bacterium]
MKNSFILRSFFERSKKKYSKPDTEILQHRVITIGHGSEFKGILRTENPVRIEGNWDGILISCNKVILDKESLFKGSIVCNEISINGKVDGDIYCSGRVVVSSFAEVCGDIYCRLFSNATEITLNGFIRLIDRSEAAFNKIFTQFKDHLPATAEEQTVFINKFIIKDNFA